MFQTYLLSFLYPFLTCIIKGFIAYLVSGKEKMFYSVYIFIVYSQMSHYHTALFFFEINDALSVSQMYAKHLPV